MMLQSWFRLACVITLLSLAGVASAQNPTAPPTGPQTASQTPRNEVISADANQDGKLSLEEAKAAFPNMPEERFKTLDKNADGFLTPNEWPGPRGGSGTPAAHKRVQRPLIARIKRTDTDQDGKITLEEARKAFPRMTPDRFNALDKNGDGSLTRDEFAKAAVLRNPGSPLTASSAQQQARQRMVQQLKKADTNGDHRLSREEAKAAFPNMPEERFKTLDKNADGFLTLNEWPGPRGGSGTPAAHKRVQRPLIARIKRTDTDQDGKITLEEARKAFPRMTPDRFNALDKNGDGSLTRDEFAKAAVLRNPGSPLTASSAQQQARQRMVQQLKKADTNGDHRLSREEAKAAFPNMPEERFRTLDKNADGYLTPNEFPSPPRPHKPAGDKPIKGGKTNKPTKNKRNANL